MTRASFDKAMPRGRFHGALEKSRAGLGAAGVTAALTSYVLAGSTSYAWLAALGTALLAGVGAYYVVDPRQIDGR